VAACACVLPRGRYPLNDKGPSDPDAPFWMGWAALGATFCPPMAGLLGRLVAAQGIEQIGARVVPLDYLARLLRAIDGTQTLPPPG
jgi:hypothetical protein